MMAQLQILKPRISMAVGKVVMADQPRNPEAEQRVRGSKWMAIRARWFREHPLCVHCQEQGRVTAANRLDHVIPLIDGGKDDDSNYQSLCEPCHDIKTAAEAKARGRA